MRRSGVMWSKFLTLVLTVLFVVAVCNPVASHDGRIREFSDPTNDEQPWGGEHNYDFPDIPLDTYPDPGESPGRLYFIRLTINFGWFSLRHIVVDAFELNTDSGKRGETDALDQTPGEITNQDQGMGTR
jgi:hypothetical protein